jgi:hypothetical protein
MGMSENATMKPIIVYNQYMLMKCEKYLCLEYIKKSNGKKKGRRRSGRRRNRRRRRERRRRKREDNLIKNWIFKKNQKHAKYKSRK